MSVEGMEALVATLESLEVAMPSTDRQLKAAPRWPRSKPCELELDSELAELAARAVFSRPQTRSYLATYVVVVDADDFLQSTPTRMYDWR